MKRLLDNIQLKKFNCILVKDISRLGRNMVQVGNLLEVVFPDNDIRLIAVNDNYDSSTYIDDESILLRTFLNDAYLKECVRKSNNTMKRRSLQGSMTTGSSYGYIWTEDKNIIINPETAPIVKLIFEKFINNESPKQIAEYLTISKVETPAYNKRKYYNTNAYKITEEEYYTWNAKRVNNILLNYQYTGNTINLRTRTVKGKQIDNPDKVILKNTHEAIISEEQFNIVKQMKSKVAPVLKPNLEEIRLKSFFKCECNSNMSYAFRNKTQNLYVCSKCKKTIKTDILHKALIADIKTLIKLYTHNSKLFETKLKEQLESSQEYSSKVELEKEKDYIENQLTKLVEKKLDMKISNIEYKEQSNELKKTLELLNTELSKFDSVNLDIVLFDTRVKQLKEQIINFTDHEDLDLIKYFVKECKVVIENKNIKLYPIYKCGLRLS